MTETKFKSVTCLTVAGGMVLGLSAGLALNLSKDQLEPIKDFGKGYASLVVNSSTATVSFSQAPTVQGVAGLSYRVTPPTTGKFVSWLVPSRTTIG